MLFNQILVGSNNSLMPVDGDLSGSRLLVSLVDSQDNLFV